jgi:Asp-tRNA(Asn)/Glu-tRNA(Gln) amidotransferase A subunit family amidase
VGAGPGRRALDGFVLGVKDVIDVAGMPTRSGSTLTSPEPVQVDAPVVAQARAAGAAIIGKTQCTEWALNDPAPTRNPWDAACTPGGSSAGSAVAVSVGMCTATLDTQTAGDVLRPAAYNGVVGLKPTIGWAPTEGTQAVAPSIDTIGVTARSVGDAAAVAAAIGDQPDRFRSGADRGPPRLGRLHNAFYNTVGPAVAANLDEMARRFSDAGVDIVDVETSVDLSLLHTAHRIITFSECAALHLGRYRSNPGRYGPKARELLDLGLVTPAYAYVEAQHIRREAGKRLADVLKDVDALMLPLVPEPAPAQHTTGDSRFQIPWTLCGFPTLALPSGLAGGLPLSVQLAASPHDDATLLAVARWCERTLDLVLSPSPRLPAGRGH